jgi:hypothetical protein
MNDSSTLKDDTSSTVSIESKHSLGGVLLVEHQ